MSRFDILLKSHKTEQVSTNTKELRMKKYKNRFVGIQLYCEQRLC